MEVAVLLLLTIPMSTTTPVRQTQRCVFYQYTHTHTLYIHTVYSLSRVFLNRTQTESLSLVKSIQRSRDVTLIDTDRETPSAETKTSRKPDLNAASSLLLQTILQKARE